MFKQLQRLVRMVEAIFGDIDQRPASPPDWFESHGVSKAQFARMSKNEMLEAASTIWDAQPTETENVIAALDLAFEQRYGWPQGTAERLVPWQATLALDHAADYDDPSKPSLWEIVPVD